MMMMMENTMVVMLLQCQFIDVDDFSALTVHCYPRRLAIATSMMLTVMMTIMMTMNLLLVMMMMMMMMMTVLVCMVMVMV